jgi:PIN domain nuclease of toxin-antitoxin system
VLGVPYARFMHDSIVGHGFRVLDITPGHTEILTTLPVPVVGGREHRDPFDRLLISQAKAEGMSIVSDDGKFPAYGPDGVPVVW